MRRGEGPVACWRGRLQPAEMRGGGMCGSNACHSMRRFVLPSGAHAARRRTLCTAIPHQQVRSLPLPLPSLLYIIYRYQGHVSAALVLGGVDFKGPHLFTVRQVAWRQGTAGWCLAGCVTRTMGAA